MRPLSRQFSQIFRQTHRQARDTLLDLLQARLNLIRQANEVRRRSAAAPK